MPSISNDVKVAILAECARLSNTTNGNLVYNGLKIVCGLFPNVSESTVKRIARRLRVMRQTGRLELNFARKCRVQLCGPSKFTPQIRIAYARIAQDYADCWIKLTERLLREELAGP